MIILENIQQLASGAIALDRQVRHGFSSLPSSLARVGLQYSATGTRTRSIWSSGPSPPNLKPSQTPFFRLFFAAKLLFGIFFTACALFHVVATSCNTATTQEVPTKRRSKCGKATTAVRPYFVQPIRSLFTSPLKTDSEVVLYIYTYSTYFIYIRLRPSVYPPMIPRCVFNLLQKRKSTRPDDSTHRT